MRVVTVALRIGKKIHRYVLLLSEKQIILFRSVIDLQIGTDDFSDTLLFLAKIKHKKIARVVLYLADDYEPH